MYKPFKTIHWFLHNKNQVRKAVAIFILVGSLVAICYVIQKDLLVEEKEESILQASVATINYHFTLKSFDFIDRTVQGDLELRFRPSFSMRTEPVKYRFGPLIYFDGRLWFLISGLGSWEKIDGMTSQKASITQKFTEHKPSPVAFELQALGEPKFYPFDIYLLVGGTKCIIIGEDAKGESKKINKQELGNITIKQNIPGFLIRRARFNEVKGMGLKPRGFQPPEDHIEKLNFKKWNKGNTFLLILDRPLFLRFMTGFLGVTAFVWVLYIILLRPISDFLINSIGYFIGLWAIREILSKGTEVFPTFIDYGTLLLYSFLILGVVVRVIWPKETG